ncbi:GntR family transcriptional regulator [soil metagenome]
MFFLNPNSGVPLYVQLQQQIQQRILSGQMVEGEQMASVREMSAVLGINPLTVTKVYQNLEREGFVESRRGIGTYVRHRAPDLQIEARRQQIAAAVEQLVTEALHLGLDEEEVRALLAEKFRQLKPKQDIHP